MNIAKYINIPFKEKGRSVNGMDCWGLCTHVLANEYDITGLPDFSDSYNNTGDKNGIKICVNNERRNWKEITEPKESAIIVFNIGGWPQHVGICTGYQQGKAMFLHVHKGINVTHERLASSMWSSRIDSMYIYE